MMTDAIPTEDNRLAVWVGRILHPYLLPLPTTLAVLADIPPAEAVAWTAVVIGIVVLPVLLLAVALERRGQYLYQRRSRQPLYFLGWLCVLVCLIVVIVLQAPRPLMASLGALAMWIPLQWACNTWVTKISGHAAVAAGCYVGLLLLGRLESALLQVTLAGMVALTLWARVVTRNHTRLQVVLGVIVGVVPVLVVFPLALS
jgi:membrane-associated phospholipid phosphatase